MREEINAFGRDAAGTRAAEALAKQKELLQAIAEDMNKSYSEVLTAFISGTDDEELRANIKNAKDILGDFSTYLSKKALVDITKTAEEYQKQVDQLGLTDREKVIDDFRRAFKAANLDIDEALVRQLGLNYDLVKAEEARTSANNVLLGYQKEIAQLNMTDNEKAIDNIERQAKAEHWLTSETESVIVALKMLQNTQAKKTATDTANASIDDYSKKLKQLHMTEMAITLSDLDEQRVKLKWTAEKYNEARAAAIAYYTAVANKSKREEKQQKADDFENTIMAMSRETLLTGKDEFTIWLMDNAESMAAYMEITGHSREVVEAWAKSVYDANKAAKDSDAALKSVNDAISDYQKKINQIGMSDRGIAILDTLETNKGATPEKLKELISLINQYYDAIEAREKRAATRDKADTFGETISDMYRDALLTGKDDMTVWLLDNAENILAYGEANNMSAGEAIKFAKAQYEQSKAIKESANNTMKLVEALQALSDMQKEVSETQYKPLSEVFGDLNAVTGATKLTFEPIKALSPIIVLCLFFPS